MPLETATYTNDLVASNPASSDQLAGADDHVRMIKGALKATFPNFTSAPLVSSQAQIDASTSATANGIAVLSDTGAFFKTHTDDGVTNPAHGEIDIKLLGVLGAKFLNSSGALSLTLPGALSVTQPINGPGITPIGAMIMWLDDNLPNTGGVWCWANGGVLSRTTAGAGLELYQEWSRNSGNPLRYGSGDGATTFNVINMQEVVPVGKSTMGGATSPGLLVSIALGIKDVLGALFGTDTTTLSTAQIPAHTHGVTDPGHTHTTDAIHSAGGNGIVQPGTPGGPAQINPAFTGISIQSTGGGGAHSNMQPTRPVNFIIRIA